MRPRLNPELLNAFRRSSALQRLADEAEELVGRLKLERRKVIPVAEVARWFDVSNRQMWGWIEQGWLAKPRQKALAATLEKGRRPARRKQGLTPGRLKGFLGRLSELQGYAGMYRFGTGIGRPPRGEEKVRQAYMDFTLESGMTPKALASKIGVSANLVRRLIRQGRVAFKMHTQCRYKLVGSSLAPRKKRTVISKIT